LDVGKQKDGTRGTTTPFRENCQFRNCPASPDEFNHVHRKLVHLLLHRTVIHLGAGSTDGGASLICLA
jgi:hypothetical protein